jgi:hypothetical protein
MRNQGRKFGNLTRDKAWQIAADFKKCGLASELRADEIRLEI